MVIAIVGLVGSGKSFVADELAKLISATVIENDKIRVCLRKEGERYEGTRKIVENAVAEIIKKRPSSKRLPFFISTKSLSLVTALSLRALFHWARFVDCEGASFKLFAIPHFDRLRGVFVISHFDETETSGTT